MSRLQRRTCALMRKDSPLQQDRVAGCEQDKSTGVGQKKIRHSHTVSTHRMLEISGRITECKIPVTIAPPSKDSVPESA